MKFLRLNLHGLSAMDQAIYIAQLLEHWRLDIWAIPGQLVVLAALFPVITDSGLAMWAWMGPVGLLLATWTWGSLSIWRLRRITLTTENYPYWRKATLLREITQSAGWGALGAVLWGALPAQWHLLILAGLIVFTYSAMFFSTHDSGVAAAIALPVLLILLVRLLVDNSEGAATIAVILGASLLTCLVVARLIEGRLMEGERLRRRNEQLVHELADEVAKVKQAKEQAEQANRQKSEFIAVASHDLRQPLHSLTLLSGLLQAELAGHVSQGTASKLMASVDALRIIFEQLFDIARIDANKVPHRPRLCSVQELLGSLDHEFAMLCQEKNLSWRCHVPSRHKGPWVQADPLFVQRILRNLLDNALRYTPAGTLTLRWRVRRHTLALQVWDTGIGIARSDRRRIFEDYTQLHNAGRRLQEGLGLGLGLVRRLAQTGQYDMRVLSKPHRGSCFTLLLPLASPPVAQHPLVLAPAATLASTTTASPAATSQANAGFASADGAPTLIDITASNASPPLRPNGKQGVVLLIEDADDVRDTMAAVLKRAGWDCFAGSHALQAIDELARADSWPDFVISDYRLADGSTGLDVIASVRQDFGLELPALLITGDLDPSIDARAQTMGVRVMRKPLSPSELVAALSPPYTEIRTPAPLYEGASALVGGH